jgi:hypothetical protein
MEAPIRITSDPGTKARVGIVNDQCPFCDHDWEQGDFSVVIGWVDKRMHASLQMVHRDCLLREVVGDQVTEHIIATERG